ncbi:MAG TPA: hypothetical protein VFM98_20200 [Ramlibacter sp.]|uniref:hypothetical protein n=1 Tax=Ramlibacter sp. TaxID=1917967 RepID=UPI002D7EFAE9|nr:hypothetical protein [Ramlibacter sp.]HET8747931.1 hypothetical protein [Ramlibacter sp.]
MSRVFSSPATFVGGSLVGGLLLAAWLGAFTGTEEPAAPTPPPGPAALAPAPSPQPVVAETPAPPQAQAVALAPNCPSEALTAPRGEGDGRFVLASALNAGAHVQPEAFIAVARESARKGHGRDAEVALLAACHLAARGARSPSVEEADLKTQIAQQYVALAAAEPAEGAREGLLQRAAAMLSESAITYSSALGRHASKTRLAEERLASLREPATLQRARSEAKDESETRVMGAARQSAPEAQEPEARAARTAPAARLISSDPELAQLERDMERLHAQARSVTRDPGGMRQRDRQALAQRDSACHDKACLLQWYAQRRSQLLDEF